MANKQAVMTYGVAKRQLNALVRKYNQATKTQYGFGLTISIDDYDAPQMINYTLIMKNRLEDAWEVRRISSMLHDDIQLAFIEKVIFMEENLLSALDSRMANA